MKIQSNQQIFLEEVSVKEIAAKYGTPTYVYEENKIRANFQKALQAFKKYYDDFKFYYAIKASNNLAIASILKKEGAGIDAASVNEILLAKEIGITGEDVMFSGNFLSDEDIIGGLENKVIFNLDDISLLPRLLKFGKPEVLSFRINPGYGRSDVGEYVTNAGPEAKFGLHPHQVIDAYQQAKDAGITRFGAHMMPGSCIRDPKYFAYITELLMNILGKVTDKVGINFEFIDLGGGLGIPYNHTDHSLDIDETAKQIAAVFKAKIDELKIQPPRLIMEPARYFVGDAGYLVGKVNTIKTGYRTIIGTDIGMNVLARPVLYDAYHHIYINGREDEPKQPYALCGQICENTDMWVKNRNLPQNTAPGDLVIVENTGAYGYGMSYSYNGRLKPAEVLVKNDKHYLIRKREDFSDMIRDVVVPDHLL